MRLATRYSLLASLSFVCLTFLGGNATAQELQEAGTALGNCNFICETFTVTEDFSNNVLPDGNGYSVNFQTPPLGFRYYPSGGQYDLQTTSVWQGTNVFWGRYFTPETNVASSYLEFPPGIAVGIAILQVRSEGGGDWEVYPADGAGNLVGGPGVVIGGDTQRRTMIMCADGFFTGLEFQAPNQNAEPVVYEVCIPQDPDACFATSN